MSFKWGLKNNKHFVGKLLHVHSVYWQLKSFIQCLLFRSFELELCVFILFMWVCRLDCDDGIELSKANVITYLYTYLIVIVSPGRY